MKCDVSRRGGKVRGIVSAAVALSGVISPDQPRSVSPSLGYKSSFNVSSALSRTILWAVP